MDRTDPGERLGKEVSKSDQASCPKCAIELCRFIDVLDTRIGTTFRLFRCECGELVWGEKAA